MGEVKEVSGGTTVKGVSPSLNWALFVWGYSSFEKNKGRRGLDGAIGA